MTAAHASGRLFSSQASGSVLKAPSSPSTRTTAAIVETLLLGATDFGLVWLAATLVLYFRVDARAITYGTMLAENAGFLVLFSILVVLFCHAQKVYEFQWIREWDEAWAVLKAVFLAAIVLSASLYLSGQHIVSRLAFAITVAVSMVLLVGWRHIRRRRMAARAAAGQDCRNILIFGWSHAADLLCRHAMEHRLPGYVIKGFLDRRRSEDVQNPLEIDRRSVATKAIGHIDELCDIVRAHFIDEIFVFLPEDRELVKDLIAEARASGVSLRVVPDFYDGLAWGAPIEHFGPFPAIRVHEITLPILGLILKRCLDVVGSATALLLCLPVSLLIAIAIRLDSPGPILYRSQRIGRKGTAFTCYKFRTMVQNADQLKDNLLTLNEREGVLFKIANDPRITRIGRFLRKYSLDEIPQFWNVLNGDMSLVGPRPPVPGEVEQYALDHLKRLHVPPGITGLWQVEARTNPSFESYINLDTHYVENWSVWLDLKILFKTVAVVFAGTGQ